ncbi:hypothetical protein [Larkinella punicea]|uniref:Uncharacterized protein n=1 Tax=Larkinella punicea TaxID=2315727 RepID=A0A368JP32_9BACT|nr:hypothetical protein [Larkinella punicea]RCR69427.1 hypothetical protein DUE52_11280 [Larkinella punicea]
MTTKTLKSFARKQAEEEKKETPVPSTETVETDETESTADDETETDGSGETEETESTAADETAAESTGATVEADKKSANVLKAGQVAINASELKQIKADAAEWNKNKGRFATLTDWHKSMQDAGANVPGKEDTSTQHDKTDSSVSEQPWNKKASEAYGKGVKTV